MNVHVPALESGLAIQDRERAETLQNLRKLRREVRDEIERLIAFLDASDIDPDLEPSLGAPEIPPSFNEYSEKYRMWFSRQGDQTRWAAGSTDGRECEPEHDETTNDEEPSLGSVAALAGNDQSKWSQGGSDDLENEHDGAEDGHDAEDDRADYEPSLGWPERMAQGICHGGSDDRELAR